VAEVYANARARKVVREPMNVDWQGSKKVVQIGRCNVEIDKADEPRQRRIQNKQTERGEDEH
jgi:hypothetical protein